MNLPGHLCPSLESQHPNITIRSPWLGPARLPANALSIRPVVVVICRSGTSRPHRKAAALSNCSLIRRQLLRSSLGYFLRMQWSLVYPLRSVGPHRFGRLPSLATGHRELSEQTSLIVGQQPLPWKQICKLTFINTPQDINRTKAKEHGCKHSRDQGLTGGLKLQETPRQTGQAHFNTVFITQLHFYLRAPNKLSKSRNVAKKFCYIIHSLYQN